MNKFVIALAGNKCDTDSSKWEITQEKLASLKSSLNINQGQIIDMNTSAKTGEGVNEIFSEIAE